MNLLYFVHRRKGRFRAGFFFFGGMREVREFKIRMECGKNE